MAGKLTSRKFWVTMFAMILGTILMVTGMSEESELIMAVKTGFGALLDILAALGYLVAESKVDVARAKNGKYYR